MIDLQLARGSTGFSVAARLNAAGIPCLFVSGKPPGFAMPDLALGCLLKPFTGEDVHRTLATAENMMRGRETLRPRLPANFTLYEAAEEPIMVEAVEQAVIVPGRPSFPRWLGRWITGLAH